MSQHTRIPQQEALALFHQAQAAVQALVAQKGDVPAASSGPLNPNAPVLRAPVRDGAGHSDTKAAFLQRMAELMALIDDASLKSLAGQLAVFETKSHARQEHYQGLSNEYEQALTESATASDDAEKALSAWQEARDRTETCQQARDRAQQKLAGMSPDNSAYPAARQALHDAEQALTAAQAHERTAKQTSTDCYQIAADKMKALAVVDGKLQQLSQPQGAQNATAAQAAERTADAASRMFLLISTFIQLLGKNSEAALESDSEMFQKIQQQRQEEMQRKSDDYTAQVRKAEALNQTMGCIGKVLGGLLTAISVVSAVFTGGASLAFAAVGLALMAADTVGKAISGVSFIEQALKPLMDNIIKPLVDALSKGITNMLRGMGVSEDIASIAGAVLGTVLAVVVIVVVALVGKVGASKVASSMLGSVMKNAIADLFPEMIKNGVKDFAKVFTSSVQEMFKKVSLSSQGLAYAEAGMGIAALGVNTGGNVGTGIYTKNAQDMLAGFTLDRAEMETVQKSLKAAVDQFAESQKVVRGMMARLSETMLNQNEAGKMVLRNIHA